MLDYEVSHDGDPDTDTVSEISKDRPEFINEVLSK